MFCTKILLSNLQYISPMICSLLLRMFHKDLISIIGAHYWLEKTKGVKTAHLFAYVYYIVYKILSKDCTYIFFVSTILSCV